MVVGGVVAAPTTAQAGAPAAARPAAADSQPLQVEIGSLNTIVHLWGYRDLAHRAEVRRALAEDAAWQAAAGRLMPLLQAQEATILVPTSYSPCR